jgi:pectinesterase
LLDPKAHKESLAHSLFNMLSLSLFTIFVWYLAQIGIVSAATIPSGAITIGSGGKYSTLSAALKDTSRRVVHQVHYDNLTWLYSNVYYIYAGTYTGQVAISRSNIKIYGETSDTSSYTGNKVTLTDNVPASSAGSNDASGTVRVLATGVKLYNLNIANTYGKVSSPIPSALIGCTEV